MEKFSSRLPRSRSQNPEQVGLSYEHIDIFTKKRVARQDLGNRASPVDQAHMKRSLIGKFGVPYFLDFVTDSHETWRVY